MAETTVFIIAKVHNDMIDAEAIFRILFADRTFEFSA